MSCHEECMGCSDCDPGPSGSTFNDLVERLGLDEHGDGLPGFRSYQDRGYNDHICCDVCGEDLGVRYLSSCPYPERHKLVDCVRHIADKMGMLG